MTEVTVAACDTFQYFFTPAPFLVLYSLKPCSEAAPSRDERPHQEIHQRPLWPGSPRAQPAAHWPGRGQAGWGGHSPATAGPAVWPVWLHWPAGAGGGFTAPAASVSGPGDSGGGGRGPGGQPSATTRWEKGKKLDGVSSLIADTSKCNCTNRPNPLIQQNC